MIIPDVNILVYAYNSDVAQHQQAKVWWVNLFAGSQPVALSCIVGLITLPC